MGFWDEEDWIIPEQWVVTGIEVMGTTFGMCWITNTVTKEKGLFKPETRWRRSAYSEYAASKVALALGIPSAKIYLGDLFGGSGCISIDVRDKSNYRVLVAEELGRTRGILNLKKSQPGNPVYEIPTELSFQGLLPFLPPHVEEKMVDMMFFDSLTMNTGRHGDNYSYLIDDNRAICGMLPLYDHGWCFQENRMMGHRMSFPYYGAKGFPLSELYRNIKRDYPQHVERLANIVRSDGFAKALEKLDCYDFLSDRLEALETNKQNAIYY